MEVATTCLLWDAIAPHIFGRFERTSKKSDNDITSTDYRRSLEVRHIMHLSALLGGLLILGSRRSLQTDCPSFSEYSQERHPPFSSGRYRLSSQRPAPSCRTFVSPEVDDTIIQLRRTIRDPDLYRLFSNAFPNTLDTTVRWRGRAANNSAEELAFIITGTLSALLVNGLMLEWCRRGHQRHVAT